MSNAGSKRRFGAALPDLELRIVLVGDAPAPYGEPITCAENVWQTLKADVSSWDRERFITIALDSAHRILGVEEVSVGSLNASIVHPREVFKGLILANAYGFICAHNHPSGDTAPSDEDLSITRRLKGVGDLLGIPLIDHIILGGSGFYSFKQSGAL